MPDNSSLLPPHGNYRELLSYQKAEVVYDLTFQFCQRFLKRGDRTIDQMVQAARSGKQNIAEASKASGTSKETELKLTNVARASPQPPPPSTFHPIDPVPVWNSDSIGHAQNETNARLMAQPSRR